ncbi:unnamed protein product [Thelazia callipaeda]|uniref:WD_REPEATS_REGION domain-containing protein n=1 Tax=Thelazia callipaeda TaxID=103827 RepID=A0A0N5CZM7_THECL|nr:unnamed protein product [Thelazia callipaeda]
MENDSECLLVSSETSDPFATVLINPKTGISCWSYKGVELQGTVTGCVELLGRDRFVVVTKNKPLLYIISIDGNKRTYAKSVVPKGVRYVAATFDGSLLFAAVHNKVYIWIVATGELVGITDAHYRPISSLILNSDDSLLVTGAEDGSLCVFLVAELMSTDSSLGHVQPFRAWQAHSLAVSDISVTRNSNVRILSCSKDSTISIHSVTGNMCLLKVSCDALISSCAIDPAECRIFLGATEGHIAQLNLYTLDKTQIFLNTKESVNGTLPLFKLHSTEITQLKINHDGSLLASGDISGIYAIWDIRSHQCLRTSSSRGAICKLQFVARDQFLHGNGRKRAFQTSVLKMQIIKKPLMSVDDTYIMDLDRVICDHVITAIRPNTVQHAVVSNTSNTIEDIELKIDESSDNVTIEALKSKVAALEKANQEIYDFAASMIIGRDESTS